MNLGFYKFIPVVVKDWKMKLKSQEEYFEKY